jgi:hypothetical protein
MGLKPRRKSSYLRAAIFIALGILSATLAGCRLMGEGNCAGDVQSAEEARKLFIDFMQKDSPARDRLMDQILDRQPTRDDLEKFSLKTPNIKSEYKKVGLEALLYQTRTNQVELAKDDAGELGWKISVIADIDGVDLFLRCSRTVEAVESCGACYRGQ